MMELIVMETNRLGGEKSARSIRQRGSHQLYWYDTIAEKLDYFFDSLDSYALHEEA